jgi:hypothetical protein
MRIKQALIIPAILALAATASIAASSTAPLAAAHASTTHAVADAPDFLYHS